MKEIKRIPTILKLVHTAWKKSPEQRFGQLLSNAVYSYKKENGIDWFYFEDDELLKSLEHWLTLPRPKRKLIK